MATRRAQLTKHIEDLRRRQTKLLDQLEDDTDDDLSPEDARAFHRSIRDRFAKLGGDIRAAEAELDTHGPSTNARRTENPELLDQLPQVELHLATAPEDPAANARRTPPPRTAPARQDRAPRCFPCSVCP